MSSYSERVRVKARSIVLLCDKDYPGLASMFYFLRVRKTQNQQQIAGLQEEGQRARDITLCPPSARNSHLAAFRFSQTGAIATENAEAALLRCGVAQPVFVQAKRSSLRPQSARHVQRPQHHPLRHHQIHRFGSFACFTGRLSRQSEPKSLRRTAPRSAYRLQIRRRLPCIRKMAPDSPGSQAFRLLARLRTAHRRLLHLPDRRFASLRFLTRRFAAERKLAAERQFAEGAHAAASAIRSGDSFCSAEALG